MELMKMDVIQNFEQPDIKFSLKKRIVPGL